MTNDLKAICNMAKIFNGGKSVSSVEKCFEVFEKALFQLRRSGQISDKSFMETKPEDVFHFPTLLIYGVDDGPTRAQVAFEEMTKTL